MTANSIKELRLILEKASSNMSIYTNEEGYKTFIESCKEGSKETPYTWQLVHSHAMDKGFQGSTYVVQEGLFDKLPTDVPAPDLEIELFNGSKKEIKKGK
jgi:hypothetical protein